MTNDMICTLMGIIGVAMVLIGGAFYFFGAGAGIWLAFGGLVTAGIGLANYERY